MLRNIVSVLISDEHGCALVKFFEDSSLIMWFAVFQNPLDNTATVRMGGKNVNLASECLDDELNMLCWDTLDGFLNHMVTVLVLDTLQNIGSKLFDELGLLIGENMLECLVKH